MTYLEIALVVSTLIGVFIVAGYLKARLETREEVAKIDSDREIALARLRLAEVLIENQSDLDDYMDEITELLTE